MSVSRFKSREGEGKILIKYQFRVVAGFYIMIERSQTSLQLNISTSWMLLTYRFISDGEPRDTPNHIASPVPILQDKESP